MRTVALTLWLALTCLVLPLGCEGDAEQDGPGDSETGDGDGDGDGDSETGDGDGDGDSDGHGNLHPDCMGDAPIVVLETTMGTMVVELDAVLAPITVANFLGYVSSGFYDDTIFHRVINGFVIQGGGYEPGLVLKDTLGTIPLELDPNLLHIDGAIAMARGQLPDTAESQWYITDGAQPNLDDNYAVFGALIDGFDVRNAISSVAVGDAPWMELTLTNVPIEDIVVTAAYCVTSWP